MDDLVISYLVNSSPDDVLDIAEDIAIEQTAEVTKPLCSPPLIWQNVVGKVNNIEQISKGLFRLDIGYSAKVASNEIPQFLSLIFGNISLKKDIRVIDISFSEEFAKTFCGPKFGVMGVRNVTQVYDRPLIVSALKPLGRSSKELADYAYQMALGGIDIIKDDHGVVNQVFSPFTERVGLVCEAVSRANYETGNHCAYFPTVNAPADQIFERAEFAKSHGASGLLLSPYIIGLDFMRVLAQTVEMPIMAHPALAGIFFSNERHGIAPSVVLGTLMRLLGADLVIFPSWGGRFPFTKEMCKSITCALQGELHGIFQSLPVPAGGLSLEMIPDLVEVYGKDCAFLIGSALYERSPNIAENARYFRSIVCSI